MDRRQFLTGTISALSFGTLVAAVTACAPKEDRGPAPFISGFTRPPAREGDHGGHGGGGGGGGHSG
jgi:hypothetical protein